MMKRKYLPFVGFFCFITGCLSSNLKFTPNERFVKQWGNESFDEFRGYSVSLRSYDLKNDPIILVYKNPPDTGICKFPFRVIVNKEKKIALSASRTVDSNCICSIDSVQLVNLAVTFCKYNIAHLSVDSAGEVTIKTEFSKTKPSLLKLMEEEKRPDSSKKWERLTGNWFQLKD